ncbi:hydrogenase maturation nickel metallochaperone HypA [Consotaella salsifontis]|uniref:Hydrogenase maturation factor HypA n=1 Tax=Consotaella salsifontis TaxID=1365950 RepID=A0A1T4LFL0_9HYPH|nr:hydrogenase maturation nickel metallochaperone HypA [Consotaella salsifontis]SJZ53411.1 hydrogenase nickel incorporation protein HypA/HybF [Consotaella salsifontis]
MHETAIVEGLIRILRDKARENNIGRISVVRLKIGRLRGIDIRQIRGCFELFAEGTLAEGARLDIDEIPVSARCRRCETVWVTQNYRLECPSCQAGDAEIIAGRELYIETFEGERTETSASVED